MQYRKHPKNADEISALSFGFMRVGKDDAQAEALVRRAIQLGVNYFDTAYMYPGNEERLGKILAKDGLRKQVKIATKLPHYFVKKPQDLDRYFKIQQKRLQTDYIDYYMIHMLPNLAAWEKLLNLGLLDWLKEKREKGEILQFGFSFHGSAADFIALIDAYDWDFCMIQYNYYDIHFQAGQAGLRYASQRGIPVVIMEPLRGGMLANKLPKAAKKIWDDAPGDISPAAWALRFLFDDPDVFSVLSGVTSLEILEENVATCFNHTPGALSDQEKALFDQARQAIRETTKVDCTACGYCLPCPRGVDIPLCLSSLNDTVLQGRFTALYWYALTSQGKNAGLCNDCGKCEPLCPQEIPIRAKLKETRRAVETFPYGIIKFIVGKLFRGKTKKDA